MERVTETLIQPNLNNTATWKTEINREVICDICENDCKFYIGTCENGEKVYNVEYAELKAAWGFGPPWDGDIWQSHICVNCVKAHIMPLMRINYKSYMNKYETGYYKDGENHMSINGVEVD